MSLDKAIQHGKEQRKPYYGSARFDHTCRNHGSCKHCERNRTVVQQRLQAKAGDALRENQRDPDPLSQP